MKDLAIQLKDTSTSGSVTDLKIVPVHDSDGKILSGLVVGDTLQQNMALILMAQPGEIKQYPTMGVGFADALLGSDLLSYRHKIRQQFGKDGLKVTQLELYNLNNITIKAKY